MAELGFRLSDIWTSRALCLAKNCQKQNDLWCLKLHSVPKYSKTSIPQNSTYTTRGVCIALLFLHLCGCCWIFSPHISSSSYLIPSFECSMCYSFLIRFRHFFSPATSLPSDSFLLFLFRFIGVIGHYHLLLPSMSP